MRSMGRLAAHFFVRTLPAQRTDLGGNMVVDILLACAAVIALMMLLLWLVSLKIGDVSFIDAFWAFGFVAVAASALALGQGHMIALVLAVTTTLWGLRLGFYLLRRWAGHGPDPRYVAMIARTRQPRWLFTLVMVFALQGVLLWIISLPLQLAAATPVVEARGWLLWPGLALWLTGLLFEVIGDAQLARFRADPAKAGTVLDTGLWRYTRHPNYFGDACLWWGLYLIAATTSGGIWAFASPLLMTGLLLKLSGVPLLEKRLKKTRPGYADYCARTSTFIPWPPRR